MYVKSQFLWRFTCFSSKRTQATLIWFEHMTAGCHFLPMSQQGSKSKFSYLRRRLGIMSFFRSGGREEMYLYSQKQPVKLSLHTEHSLCPHKRYYWQKSTCFVVIFFPLKKNDDKIMSLFTDSLWRMRVVKPITLIIQYKLFILLFHKT